MRKINKWRWLRLASQTLALLAFLYLLVSVRPDRPSELPHDLFFHLDPLAGISAMMAGRQWLAPMAIGAITIALTFTLGRAWCGWLCPMGTVLDLTKSVKTNSIKSKPLRYWPQVKYILLFTILISAIFGSLTLMILDPVTLLFRTVTGVILPAINYLVTAFEQFLYPFSPFQTILERFDSFIRGPWLPPEPAFYPLNTVIALVFLGIVALNVVRARFWCRYLCPLGALLAVVSRYSWLRRTVAQSVCTGCRKCANVCTSGAVDAKRSFASDPAECILCLKCREACPVSAIRFQGNRQPSASPAFDPSRRRILTQMSAAAFGALLLRWIPVFNKKDRLLVRPPGATEDSLTGKCIRCGECLNICPTRGLQPCYSPGVWDRLWTPALISRLGYCDYSCNACGQACPTTAIEKLSLEAKRQTVIGIARIDEKRCIPFAEKRDCIVCEEMCPVPQKAVRLEDTIVAREDGTLTTVRQPSVVQDLCIGCGICEYQCPINGESAIRIYTADNAIIMSTSSGMKTI